MDPRNTQNRTQTSGSSRNLDLSASLHDRYQCLHRRRASYRRREWEGVVRPRSALGPILGVEFDSAKGRMPDANGHRRLHRVSVFVAGDNEAGDNRPHTLVPLPHFRVRSRSSQSRQKNCYQARYTQQFLVQDSGRPNGQERENCRRLVAMHQAQ
jgi:hypothetical protein